MFSREKQANCHNVFWTIIWPRSKKHIGPRFQQQETRNQLWKHGLELNLEEFARSVWSCLFCLAGTTAVIIIISCMCSRGRQVDMMFVGSWRADPRGRLRSSLLKDDLLMVGKRIWHSKIGSGMFLVNSRTLMLLERLQTCTHTQAHGYYTHELIPC